jgi:aspartyl-tRNA(Asn)/glutamyl-tRNA(Gln) amidotransferase subunit B
MDFEAVIGLETHVELQTKSKMFCVCPVVDSVSAPPNTAVCPVCAGLPGSLPVLNRQAVEFALRVALALDCRVNPTSIFARKNYFYPDLPKGYQISQYEQPLAVDGCLLIHTSAGEKTIHVRRVHLEEDTGKLTHVTPPRAEGQAEAPAPYTLVDLNRAGVPLMEIVTEPDFRSAEEVRAYAESLRRLLRYLGVNSGDLEKGVLRVEPNISVRPRGQEALGTKVEVKNLNSFRALERSVAYEIGRHAQVLEGGGRVEQETVGWDEAHQATYSQRSKEEAHDYRYFPEPDLPPLAVSAARVEAVRRALPELPDARRARFMREYGLPLGEALLLTDERPVAEYFERAVQAGEAPARTVATWMTGELFAYLNQSGLEIEVIRVAPGQFAALLGLLARGEVNAASAKAALAEMFSSGRGAAEIVAARGLGQLSDRGFIARIVAEALAENPNELARYRAGKAGVANWLFGQVMRKAGGRADPQLVREELARQLGG